MVVKKGGIVWRAQEEDPFRRYGVPQVGSCGSVHSSKLFRIYRVELRRRRICMSMEWHDGKESKYEDKRYLVLKRFCKDQVEWR